MSAEERGLLREQLGRIAQSRTFARCERLNTFLRFVCQCAAEGRLDELKETLIGVAVFGRPADYDPKSDSIVRTEASRLRSRLLQYYESEGEHEQVRIALPKGGYVPDIRFLALPRRVEQQRKKWWPAAAAAPVLIAAGLLSWAWAGRGPGLVIAVLPFENQSGDASQDYFSEAVSTEIHHFLSSVEGVRVIGRASAAEFRSHPQGLSQAARTLPADYLLTGAVRRDGGRVTLRAEMTQTSTMMQIWSFGTVEDDSASVQQLEENIARQAVNALRRKLGDRRRRYDLDPELYDQYSRANYHLAGFRAPRADLAIPTLEAILRKQPDFAPAHAALSMAYLNLSFNRAAPLVESEAKMKQAALRAMELDPLLPDAHSALGFCLTREYRWDEAAASFRRALQLDPSSSVAYYGLGFAVYTKSGRFADAERVLREGLRTDPLSTRLQTSLMIALHFGGSAKEAVQLARSIPSGANSMEYATAQATIVRIECMSGPAERSIETARRNRMAPWEAYCQAKYGRAEEARRVFERAPDDIWMRFGYYAGTQDAERLIAMLEEEYRGKTPGLPFHLNWPEFHFLRADRRYHELRRLTGLAAVAAR